MRQTTHSARPISIPLVAFGIALCAATAALALPPSAEGAIHLGSPNTVSLANGLVGYWPLDGATTNWTSNTTRDLSGNGNTGTLVSMSTTSSPVAGKIGQAFKLTHNDDYIDLGTPSSLNFDRVTPFSMSVWFKTIAAGNQAFIIKAPEQSPYTGYWFQIYGGNVVMDLVNGAEPSEQGLGIYTDATFNDGKWHHAVATYDGSSNLSGEHIYIDGVAVATTQYDSETTLTGSVANSYPVRIGADGLNPPSDDFNGLLDDIRIYNRALSATEIKQLYNLGAATIAHSNAMISNGLVGYWTFDGAATNWTTGVTRDLSGNGNNGSLAFMSTSSSPVAGKIGQAFNFDKTDSISVPYSSILNPTRAMTITAWVKYRSFTDSAILSEGDLDGGDGSYSMGTGCGAAGNHFVFSPGMPDGSLNEGCGLFSNASASLNTWYHVVGTYDGSYIKIYVNGSLDNSFATSTTMHMATNSVIIGGYFSPGNLVDGTIDDVRIYNRSLSATEVKQLYKTGAVNVGHSNALISDGLVGYWTFDGGSIDWRTNTVRDVSGNGNTGSLALMSTTTSPVGGKIGQAMDFNGSTNYINMGNVLHPTGAFTYSAWINMSDLNPVGGTPSIMGKYNDPIRETWFGINSSGGTPLSLYVYGPDSDNNYLGRTYSGSLSLNKWYHVVGVYDGGTTNGSIKLYLNGVRVDDGTDSRGTFDTIPSTSAPFQIGATDPPDYLFAGKIDDVRVYNRALSATEVKQLYNAGR